jgi:hypothetical protein
VRKDKLTRLERATRAGREGEELKAIYLNTMAQIRALADGKEPPPHPRASALGGTLCAGRHRIKGGGSGPVEDLSEPRDAPGGPRGVPDPSE